MLELILASIGLILSAFFSGSEIAFIQSNRLQLEVWVKQGHRNAKTALDMISEPERFLTTVLVGTNVANVLCSSFATILFINSGMSSTTAAISISVIILIFGEIVPKVIFRDFATTLSMSLSPINRLFELLFSPILTLVRLYSKLISSSDESSHTALSRDDLKMLYQTVDNPEEIEPEEKEVIENIFEFGSQPVHHAMTPLSDVTTIHINTSIPEAIRILKDTGYSKIPVHSDNNELVGVVFLQDFFSDFQSVKEMMRPAVVLNSSVPANTALEMLKQKTSSIAIITDDAGVSLGIITIEDLIEELFGEFEDVFDDHMEKIKVLSDGSLIVDSIVEVEDLNAHYNFTIPEGSYETLAGFILSKLGRIPVTGELADFKTFSVKVLRRSPNRLERLHLYKNT